MSIERTKPTFTGADMDQTLAWIKTHIIDNLPTDATVTYLLHINP